MKKKIVSKLFIILGTKKAPSVKKKKRVSDISSLRAMSTMQTPEHFVHGRAVLAEREQETDDQQPVNNRQCLRIRR